MEEKRAEWAEGVTRGFEPGAAPFIACLPTVLVIGGEHWLQAGGFCWCQPRPRPHNDHVDYEHKRTMD